MWRHVKSLNSDPWAETQWVCIVKSRKWNWLWSQLAADDFIWPLIPMQLFFRNRNYYTWSTLLAIFAWAVGGALMMLMYRGGWCWLPVNHLHKLVKLFEFLSNILLLNIIITALVVPESFNHSSICIESFPLFFSQKFFFDINYPITNVIILFISHRHHHGSRFSFSCIHTLTHNHVSTTQIVKNKKQLLVRSSQR